MTESIGAVLRPRAPRGAIACTLRVRLAFISAVAVAMAGIPCQAQTVPAVTWTSSTQATGSNPQSVATADLNGDGISDIIAGTPNGIGVRLGNGDGTFKATTNFPALAVNQFVAVAAFRKSGLKDVITVSNSPSSANNVAVLFGDGKGSLGAASIFSLPVGSAPSLAIGDFNKDGNQDFVTVGNLSGTSAAAVFMGKGDGTFSAPLLLPVGGNLSSVAVGNFNGKGQIDLAVAHPDDNTIAIFSNDGLGNFLVSPDVTVGRGPVSIAVGDFNGDGVDDLAVVNNTDNTVSICLGQGHGGFKAPTTLAVGHSPSSIVVGDFNRDGHEDLAVTNQTDNTISILLGQGDGTFTAQTTAPTGQAPIGLAVGNFNGHGAVDLVVANSGSSNVTVLSSQLAAAAPVFTITPTSETLGVGSDASFNATATGGSVTYQWQKGGAAISGATSATLTLTNIQSSDAGSYTLVATNSAGSTSSPAVTLTVESPIQGRIVNLSVRSQAGTGSQTLITGFGISGTNQKSLLIRGSGPTLGNFGVTGFVQDPIIDLFQGSSVITENDNWGTAPDQAAILAAGGNMEGTFTLNSKDSIILASLPPVLGGYTTQLRTADNSTGVALVELFDTDSGTPGTPEYTAQPRLTNISARSQVGTGDNILITGFVINGNMSKHLMIRASGPTLTNFGVTGVLADPILRLYKGSTEIAENDDWTSSPNVAAIMAGSGQQEGAYTLNNKDSIIWITLPPGVYTAQVSGVNNTTGVALVEVFDLQ